MLTAQERVTSLSQLRTYVRQTLCDKEQLELDAFRMSERILVRGEKPCGILFCLHGPRSVKFTAVWETERNTILFYGATGERFHRTQLVAAPELN